MQAITVNVQKVPAGGTRYEAMLNFQPAKSALASTIRVRVICTTSWIQDTSDTLNSQGRLSSGFLQYCTTLRVLRFVCFRCSYIWRKEETLRERRLEALAELILSRKNWDHCQVIQPKCTKSGPFRIIITVADFPGIMIQALMMI